MLREDIRQIVIRKLEKESIPYNKALPFVEENPEQKWKSGDQIARRIIILYALTGLAHNAEAEKLLKWLEEESVSIDLLTEEKDVLTKTSLSEKEKVKLSWHQESLHTLAWCIGIRRDLGFPDKECNLSTLFSSIPPEVPVKKFIRQATRINKEKIIEIADLYYCYHWAARHPEVWEDKFNLNLDVIIERRRALEWVIGSAEKYNEVSLDT